MSRSKPDFVLEEKALSQGLWPVAGVDEAGRGPLAGPVVAAAVVLDPEKIPHNIDDSKRLSKGKREKIFEEILQTSLGVAVASVRAEEIDRVNILKASLEAMRRAVYALPCPPLFVLVDGRDVPHGLEDRELMPLIRGDSSSLSIAAASIVAKVIRDRMMSCCSLWNETYGFERNAGYPTLFHREAFKTHGPLGGMHRMSFRSSSLLPEK